MASSSVPRKTDGYEPAPSLFTAFPILVLAAVALAGGLYVGEAGFAALGALVLSAAVLARTWAAVGAWRVSGTGVLDPAWTFPGEPVHHRLRLRNDKPLPARLDVRVTLEAAAPRRPGLGGPIPLAVEGGSGSGVVLPPGGEREFRAVWTPPARGLYVCRAVVVSSDPWGWFAATRPAGEAERLWVYPSLYPLASPLPWPRHDSLDGSVRSAGLWENRLSYRGVRPDGTGSLQDVDWRATARFQQLHFKERDRGSEGGLYVFLDAGAPGRPSEASEGGDTGSTPAADEARLDALELALSLAASVLWERWQAGDAVGFATNAAAALDARPAASVARSGSVTQFQRLLAWMAALHWKDPLDWNRVLAFVGGLPPGMAVAVVSVGAPSPALRAFAVRRRAWLLQPVGAGTVGHPWPGPRWAYALEAGAFALYPPGESPTRVGEAGEPGEERLRQGGGMG